MATHGSLGEFDAGQDDWSTYLEHVKEYFVANDTGDSQAKKRDSPQLLWNGDVLSGKAVVRS